MAYEFGGFQLDADRRLLLSAASGEPIRVGPKVLETLVYLVEHRGELVEKDALMKALWPRVVVEDNSLDRNISTLRRVLGERAGENRFIVTVPRLGYRFVAEVAAVPAVAPPTPSIAPRRAEPLENRSASPPMRATPPRFTARSLTAFAAVAALAVAVVVVRMTDRKPPDLSAPDQRTPERAASGFAARADTVAPASVAVMPLANLTGDPSLRYLGDGISEELIYSLGHVRGLKVPARMSSFAYRGRDVDVREIARDLGVATVLEGSLRSAADAVRVTVQLVDAQTGFHIWSQSYDRRADDMFGLQAELAAEVVQSLSPSLHAGASDFGPARPTTNPKAYRLFLEGNALVGASDANVRMALSLYDSAVALDPAFARAISARAAARLVLVGHGALGLASLADAERDARLAISLDPHVANAHAALGNVLSERGQWLEAEDAYRTALSKSGNDPMIVGAHTTMISIAGRLRAGLEEAETAYRLAPLALPAIMRRAMAYSVLEQDEAALRDAALGISFGAPTDTGALPFLLSAAAQRQGRHAEAAAHLAAYLPADVRAAGAAAAIDLAYEGAANPAKRAAAAAALRDLSAKVRFGDQEQRRDSLLLLLYTMIGDLDDAYAAGNGALDAAARSGSIGAGWWVVWLPSMRPFRLDSRFDAFVERLKIKDYWEVYGPPDGCAVERGKITCG